MKPANRVTLLLVLLSLILTACGGGAATPEPTQAEVPTQPSAPTEAAQPTEAPPTEAAPTEVEVPTEPRILNLRVPVDLTNADPAFHPASTDTMVSETVHEGLVTFKPGTWEVVNVLAEEITSSEDGLRIDFKLREGVQFQKGYGELTAEDVKFSYERFLDPELDASYKGDWENLDHVEVTGTYTGTIVLKQPFAPLWTSTLPVTAGVILSKKAVEDIGVDQYGTNPVGTGPYEFAEWAPNQKIVMRRYDGYWGEPAYWDEIQMIPIVDDSASEIALETGEVDFGEISETGVERFEGNDEFELIPIDTLNYDGLLMNVQHPNLQDPVVRQAIRYAIDVPAILDAAYEGKAARACALIAPGQIGYWADAPCYERDVEKARQLLAQAGVAEGLDITVTVFNSEKDKTVAEIVQANLAEVGINVEVVPQDESAYWDGGFGETGLQERQLTYITWTTTNPDPSWSTVWFTCDQLLQWNWMYWCDENFTQLHKDALVEQDPDARAEMYVEMQQVWDEASHTVWVAHPTRFFAVRSGLEPALSPNGNIIPIAFREK